MEKRMELHETKQYSAFKLFEHNREIDEKMVIKLKKNIEEFGLICPIVTTKDLYIIDGQHRLKALMELNMAVDYVVNAQMSSKAVIEANNTQKGWATINFIKSYAKKGYADYIELLKLMDLYSDFSISSVYTSFAVNGKHCISNIKKGEYRLDINKGTRILESCRIMSETLKHRAFGVKFVRAIHQVISKNPHFSVDRLLRKSRMKKLNVYDDSGSNVEEIIEIYNHKLKKQKRLI